MTSKSMGMRLKIETDFSTRGMAVLSYLDEMEQAHRLDLLRSLLAYETERIRERIEELTYILPLEDRP